MNHKIAGDDAALLFKAKTLTVISSTDSSQGLAISSAGSTDTKNTVVEFTDGITVTKGTISLSGTATGTAGLASKEITLAGATTGDANITVGSRGVLGYDLNKKGAAATDPAQGTPKNLANYSDIKVGANGKISAKGTDGKTVINAGNLTINKDGTLNTEQGDTDADDHVVLNLVTGELNDGTITTVASGGLTVKFAEGVFVKSSAHVDKKLTLTKGTLTLGSDITLSGEGKLVVANDGAELTVTAAGAGITLTNGAAYAPKDVETAKAVAGKLPLTIGANGVLDFGANETNLDKLTFGTNAAIASNQIGLDAAGIIKGDTLSLTEELGTAGIVSGKTVNLGKKDGAEVAFATSTFKVGSNLNVGTNTKAKDVVLTAGDVAAINKAHANDGPNMDNNIKADALAQTGSFGTVEGVTDGTLTIDASDGKLDVVNGTWTNNNVHVVLGGDNEVDLNVGAADTTNKTAAKLVFDNGSKLEIKKGTISVGNDDNKVLSAELDISALEGENLKFTSGSIVATEKGTIKAKQNLIDAVLAQTNAKLEIGNAGTLEIIDGIKIDADKLTTTDEGQKLHFNGASGKLATLKSDSVTINNATGANVNIGEHGVIEANTLTLNNNDGTYQDVTLDEGKFVVKQTLTSDGSDLKATLAKANTTLELGKIVEKGDYSELARASGSVGLDLDLTSGSKVNVVGGQWGLQDVTVTNGTVTVGNDTEKYDANDKLISAQVSGGKLALEAGKVEVKEGSSATFTELFTTNGANTTVNGVLTVVGKHNAAVTTPTPAKENYGASINNTVEVTGANAKLVIGKTALGSIADYQDAGAGIKYTTDVDPLFTNNGKVTLTKFGTLELQFDKSTQFSLNDLASLRKGVTGETDSLEAGFISIGNASLTDSVVSGGTITAENLEKIKDFKDIVIQDIANATVTDVDSSTVVTGNVGNIQAKTNVSEVKIGQATLNKANDKNQFAVNANGKQVDLVVKEGGYLHLVNDGKAKNITLANGSTPTQKTNLVVKGKADGQTIVGFPTQISVKQNM